MIELNAVSSTSVAALGYDPDRQELHVQFHTNMTVYVYQGVPLEAYNEMMAGSIGSYVQRVIKPNYPVYVR